MTQQMMNHGNTNQLIILCLFFLAEIADNASLSVEETGSSATESTDSIGSLRNSSPENAEKCVMREKNRSSDAMSRLSPMVTGNTLLIYVCVCDFRAKLHKLKYTLRITQYPCSCFAYSLRQKVHFRCNF